MGFSAIAQDDTQDAVPRYCRVLRDTLVESGESELFAEAFSSALSDVKRGGEPSDTDVLHVVRSLSGMGKREAACAVAWKRAGGRVAPDIVQAIIAQGSFDHSCLVMMRSGLVSVTSTAMTTRGWVVTIDLSRIRFSSEFPVELELMPTLRRIVEASSVFFDHSRGRGFLKVTGGAEIPCSGTVDLASWLYDWLEDLAGRKGWASEPHVIIGDASGDSRREP